MRRFVSKSEPSCKRAIRLQSQRKSPDSRRDAHQASARVKPRNGAFLTAHVGYTFSNSDYNRIVDAEYELMELEGVEEMNLLEQVDYIDLSHSRDFLTENKQYDVVILHYLFNPGDVPIPKHVAETFPTTKTSPLQSPEAWRERLIATEAKYILVYGSHSTEIRGWYIGDLPGYERDEQEPTPFRMGRTLYTKLL